MQKFTPLFSITGRKLDEQKANQTKGMLQTNTFQTKVKQCSTNPAKRKAYWPKSEKPVCIRLLKAPVSIGKS